MTNKKPGRTASLIQFDFAANASTTKAYVLACSGLHPAALEKMHSAKTNFVINVNNNKNSSAMFEKCDIRL